MDFMFKYSSIFAALAIFVLPPTLLSQEINHIPDLVDGTHKLLESESGRVALKNFHDLKKSGKPFPNSVLHANLSVGDTLDFNVRTYTLTDSARWEPKTFVLQHEGSDFFIWAELREVENGNVKPSDIDVLAERLGSSTLENSINPNQGILANNHDVFGLPPDYDGDGKLDVLLHDINEGTTNGGVVAGSVNPGDIDPNAVPGQGNQRDVIYLDTNPILVNFGPEYVGVFVAHEYQHLIHFNYDIDENLFINEGLSELAIHVNGYPWRSVNYLLDPDNPYYNVPLLSFAGQGGDYSRAALFFSYLLERFGLAATASLTQSPLEGVEGVRDAIPEGSPLSLEDVIENFHIANYLNDQSLGEDFGYEDPRRASTVRVELPRNKRVDGNQISFINTQEVFIEAGAVEYFDFESVIDFSIRLQASSEDLRSTIYLLRESGQHELIEIEGDGSDVEFTGEFRQVVLISSNTAADGERTRIEYDARWSFSPVFVSEIQYDDGLAIGKDFLLNFSLSSSNTNLAEISTAFDILPGTYLKKVQLAPYFLNQYANGGLDDASLPRDFTVVIRDDDGGVPGEILHSVVVEDPRLFSTIDRPFLRFLDVHFELKRFDIGFPLPERIHIGIANAGDDPNLIAVRPSKYDGPNTSHLVLEDSTGQVGWSALQSLSLSIPGGSTIEFDNTTYPIRATFVTDPLSVSNETTALEIDSPHLTNYPNPFSDRTTISFSISEAQSVQIKIFDVNGRVVQSIDPGFLASGRHEIEVGEDNWANGLYLFELQTADEVRRGTMMHAGER